jgi:hypothetical protein
MKMKTLFLVPCVLLTLFAASKADAGAITNAQGFYVITNPPPSCTLAWSPVQGATYNLYQGVVSGGYTNIILGISTTNTVFVFDQSMRGVKAYFTVTAVIGSLESHFSNEVNYTPQSLPSSVTVAPPVTLVVQHSQKAVGPFSDMQLSFSVDPSTSTNDFFRLRIVGTTPVPLVTQPWPMALPRATMLPPMPR